MADEFKGNTIGTASENAASKRTTLKMGRFRKEVILEDYRKNDSALNEFESNLKNDDPIITATINAAKIKP